MPSSRTDGQLPQSLRWENLRVVHIVADVQESDTTDDLEEYSARLGVVLQLARRSARFSQVEAAPLMGMSTASFTRWEQGQSKISAYDLARLVRLYQFDPDLAINPPASKVEIRRRLGPVADAARGAVRRGLLQPLPPDENEPD